MVLFEDCFELNHPMGQSRIKWADLVKVKELHSGLLLFLTTRIVYYIPKKAFTKDPAEYERLKGIIKAKKDLK